MLTLPRLTKDDLETTRKRSETLVRAGDLTPSERTECERWYSVCDELLALREENARLKDENGSLRAAVGP